MEVFLPEMFAYNDNAASGSVSNHKAWAKVVCAGPRRTPSPLLPELAPATLLSPLSIGLHARWAATEPPTGILLVCCYFTSPRDN